MILPFVLHRRHHQPSASFYYLQQPFPFSQKLRNKKLFFHTSIVISYGMYQVADGLSLFGMLTVVCVFALFQFFQTTLIQFLGITMPHIKNYSCAI